MRKVIKDGSDLAKENATLRDDVARLTEAIEIAHGWLVRSGNDIWAREVVERAFPPAGPSCKATEDSSAIEYDDVEVKRYECEYCGNISRELRTTCACCNGVLFELSATRRIPRKKKVKKTAKGFRNIVTGGFSYCFEGANPDWVDAVLTWEE